MSELKCAFETATESRIVQTCYLLMSFLEGATAKMLFKMMLRTDHLGLNVESKSEYFLRKVLFSLYKGTIRQQKG